MTTNKKSWLSPFVAVAFVILALTGTLLFYHVKSGPIMMLHEWFGWGFVVAGLIHLLLNARALWGYLRNPAGRASLAAGLLLALGLFVAGLNHRKGGPPPRAEVGQTAPSVRS